MWRQTFVMFQPIRIALDSRKMNSTVYILIETLYFRKNNCLTIIIVSKYGMQLLQLLLNQHRWIYKPENVFLCVYFCIRFSWASLEEFILYLYMISVFVRIYQSLNQLAWRKFVFFFIQYHFLCHINQCST